MKDLSDKLNWATGLMAGESMSAGNTVCHSDQNAAMGAPGSQPVNKLPDVLDVPELEVQGAPTKPTTLIKPGSSIPSSGNWQKAGE